MGAHVDLDLEADYLIVGSGAVGMAFADVLFHETDRTMVVVDRHHAPGGHWNDAYPFIRLHTPSAFYGVNYRELGALDEDDPLDHGMSGRAGAAAILAYYEDLMHEFAASGRMRYLPMTEYTGDFAQSHRARSLLTGETSGVRVRRRIIDTTYFGTEVPSTHPPNYEVADGLQCIPPNGLARIDGASSGFVVIGGGKTGIDVCLWLLANRVDPDLITWIVPRDAWFVNRVTMQPRAQFFDDVFGGFAVQAEIAASATTIHELFERLEDAGQLLRLDRAVTPTMYHGASISATELNTLRSIRNVARLGRLRRIEPTRMVLDRGTIGSDPQRLYIDCSARGVPRRPPLPVFDGPKILAQMVRSLQPTFSAAFVAHVEVTVDDDGEKNALCRPIPMPDSPHDWPRLMIANLANQSLWRESPDLRQWILRSRLDRFSALASAVTPDQPERLELLHRYGAAVRAAPANLERLLTAEHGAPA